MTDCLVSTGNQYAYIPHQPSPKQEIFLRLGCREALYGGSAGCGKSDALLMAAAQGINIPGYSGILFRRTYRDLALPGALMDRARSWWLNSPAHWSHDDKTWTFPSGARIGFGYLDSATDLERYQSAEFHFIGLDEQSQFTADQVTFLFSRLRRTKDFPSRFPVRLRGATNPGGIGHEFIVNRYGIPTDKGATANAQPIVTRDTDGSILRVFVPAHASDNPGLDWEDYRKSLAQLSPIRRMQLEEGLWVQDSSGLVYSSAADAMLVDALPAGYSWNYVLSVDIGATDNCALAVIAVCENLPEVYLLSTSEPLGLDTPRDLAMHVRSLDDQFHFSRIVGDHGALGKGYLEEMRRYFQLPIRNAEKHDKRGYIELFNGALSNRMLRIVRRSCETWIRQTSTLLWKNDKREDEMPGMPNHSCDAALYGWREARHYSHEPLVIPARQPDAMEQLLARDYEREQQDLQNYGMVLPDYYR
jgi:hypothetical protein